MMKIFQEKFEENSIVTLISYVALYVIIIFAPKYDEFHPSKNIYVISFFTLLIISRLCLIYFGKDSIIIRKITISLILASGLFWSTLYLLEVLLATEFSQMLFLILLIIIAITAGGAFSLFKIRNLNVGYQTVTLLPVSIYSFIYLPELNIIMGTITFFFYVFFVSYVIKYNKIWTEFLAEKQKSENQSLLLQNQKYELEQKNISLDKALEQSQVATKTKSEFLANMSHEIRTPLNGIIGATEILSSMNLAKDEKNVLSIISKSGRSLLSIINDILDFSKIEAGKLDIENHRFNIQATIENLIDQLSFKANEKKIELISYINSDVPENLIGDESRIIQVLFNIVGNAVKFTDTGHVYLKVQLHEKSDDDYITLLFTVEDSGIGIPKEKLELIFDSFTQVDGSINRKFGGTGLGTTISKMIVNLLGGKIWAESPNYKLTNQKYPGTIFFFTIKLKVDHTILSSNNLSFDLRKIKALIVDDNDINRFVLHTMLTNWKIDYEEASNGKEAIEIIRNNNQAFDLLLIDFAMPEMNGLELFDFLNTNNYLNNSQTIILSSDNFNLNIKICNEKGIKYCIYKPIKQSVMFDTIQNIFGGVKIENITEPIEYEAKSINKDIKILLVEDNDINRKIAVSMFKNIGYEIRTTENGKEAIELLDKEQFNLVFMDVQMPILDGIEATIHLRNKGNKTIIIAMTANAMKGDREICINAGMNDYISKPVQIKELEEIINKWI